MRNNFIHRPIPILLVVGLAACASPKFPDIAEQSTAGSLPGEAEDPFNVEYSFEITESGEFVNLGSEKIPSSAYSNDPSFLDNPGQEVELPEAPTDQVSPILKERLARLPLRGSELQRVILSFKDDTELPRFAQAVPDEPIDSPANQRVIARNEGLIQKIEAARKPAYNRVLPKLEALGAKVIRTSWLTGGVVIDVPLQAVSALLKVDGLLYITSSEETSPPPITVAEGRSSINSDSFYNQGGPINDGGMIALLDTGVRESHTLISQGSYSRVRDQFNCYGSNSCTSQSSSFLDPCNHGTSSAAVLSANTSNNSLRGVTGIGIDSYITYPPSSCGLDVIGATLAFERAIARGHKVIVAEMQAQVAVNSDLTRAAERAFDTGAVVIAANGNTSQVSAVGSPANGHRVIGVGNFTGGQVYGPVDGRNKPDILAPTCSVTASSISTTATRTYCGTSGSTPFAAGTAALVRNYFQHELGIIEPGYVYAYLINSGDDPYPFTAAGGAGRLRVGGNAQYALVATRSMLQERYPSAKIKRSIGSLLSFNLPIMTTLRRRSGGRTPWLVPITATSTFR